MFNGDANYLGIDHHPNGLSIILGKSNHDCIDSREPYEYTYIKACNLLNITRDNICNNDWNNILLHFYTLFGMPVNHNEYNLREVLVETDVPSMSFTRFIRMCATTAPDCMFLFERWRISESGLGEPGIMVDSDDYPVNKVHYIDKLTIKMMQALGVDQIYNINVNNLFIHQQYQP